jgi:hypothetical protein
MINERQAAQAVRDLVTMIQGAGISVSLAGTHEWDLELWVGEVKVLDIDRFGHGGTRLA